MRWVITAIAALPLFPFAFLWALMRKLRRRGRPDVAGERVLLAWLAGTAIGLAVTVVFPDRPGWVLHALYAPLVLLSFGFLATRIRLFPEALFSPATVRRWRSCRGHR